MSNNENNLSELNKFLFECMSDAGKLLTDLHFEISISRGTFISSVRLIGYDLPVNRIFKLIFFC